MDASAGRKIVLVAAAIGLAIGSLGATPIAVIAAGCPAGPPTLAAIVRVPSLWDEMPWAPDSIRRVACFGDTSISFVARGGMLMAAFPGVDIAPSFGRTFYFDSDPADDDPWDMNAWVPLDVDMDPDDLRAFEMTSPGLSVEGWHDVWWRGSGHFDDPAAADCRPDDGTSKIDDIPLVLSPAEAIEFCRNEFVLDELHWLPVPPTDTLTLGAEASPGPAVGGVAGILAGVVAFLAAVRWKTPVRPVAGANPVT